MPHDERDDYDDQPWRRPRPVEDLVRLPALALQCCGWLFAVSAMAGVALFVIFLLDQKEELWPGKTYAVPTNLALSVWFMGLGTLWAAGLFRAARRMRIIQGYTTAMLGAWLAVLPVAFPHAAPITTPVGIWALVVLLRSDVRARFAEVRTDANRSPPARRER